MSRIRVALAILLLSFVCSQAAFGTPSGFRRAQVYLHPTFQMGHFVGPLADSAGWSVGFGVTQGLQLGYLGLNVTLNTEYFLTTDAAEPPPFNRGLQLARVQVAGRFIYPFGDFWPFVEISAARINLISNSLVEEMGPELNRHSIGGNLGIRFFQLAPLYLELQTSWMGFLDLEDSSMVQVQIALGIRSML